MIAALLFHPRRRSGGTSDMVLAWAVKCATVVAAAATAELLTRGEILTAVAALPVVWLMVFAARQRARRRARRSERR